MATGTLKLRPADQGRAMSIAEFQAAEFGQTISRVVLPGFECDCAKLLGV